MQNLAVQDLETIPRLLQDVPTLWRGGGLARPAARATGFPALDACLPGGGWPVGALVEIVPACAGVGEFSLLLPLLRDLCREGRPVVLIAPPHVPYAPALVRAGLCLDSLLWIEVTDARDAQWSAEQVLRAGVTGAVLFWSMVPGPQGARRLQVAAESGGGCAFLYRPPPTLAQASPAAVRISLLPHPDGVHAKLLKVRGGRGGTLVLPLGLPAP